MRTALVGGLLALSFSLAASAEEPAFDVLRYDLALRVEPPTKAIHGEATLTIQPRAASLERAAFALNDFLSIRSVRRDDQDARFERGARVAEGRAITVVLDPPLAQGKSCRLTVTYDGQGLDPDEKGADWMGILLVRDDEIRMSHQSQWYPIVPRDPEARSRLAAPTRLDLDLPAGMESLGPGVLEGVAKQKDRAIHTWTSVRPVQPSIVAGKFKVQVVERNKVSVRVLAFPDHAAGAKSWAEEATQALGKLEERLGQLDLPRYGLAEMRVKNRSRSYNYEADGFSVYDGVLFDGRPPDMRKIGHEVAHLWWGGAVDAVGRGERFLTESLAEHTSWLYIEARSGEKAATEAALAAVKRYAGSPGDEASPAENDFRSPRYAQVAYAKGALVLRTLRDWIGSAAYDAGLREYLAGARSRGGAATLENFLEVMRAKDAAAVEAWTEDWLRRPGVPRYQVEIVSQAGKRVTGKLVQTGALYRNPIEVELRPAAGKPVVVRIAPAALEQGFEAQVASKVESIEIDPRVFVLFAREKR